MNALVGVDADLARIGKPHGASGLEPFGKKVAGQPFARFELDHFAKPGLGNIEDEKAAGDQGKNEELIDETLEIPRRHRIVERPIPGVETHLGHDGCANHRNDRDSEHRQGAASLRGPQRQDEFAELTDQFAESCRKRQWTWNFSADAVRHR